MELSTALLLGLLLLALWKKFSGPKDFPPGPLALPVLGNVLQMDFSNPLKTLRELSKVYGPVYSIYLGFTPAVVIQGFKDLKEVLVNKGIDFADRPQNRVLEAISGIRGLVATPYGRVWKEHRRFTMSTLRNFGLGKNSMEERIREESVYLIDEFRKNQDTLVDPHIVIDNAVANIICSNLIGRRFDYDDDTFRDILNAVHENMKIVTGFWAQVGKLSIIIRAVESHLEQLTEHLTEEEQEVRNSDKENKEKKHLERKWKEKLYNAFGFVKYLPLPHQKIFRNLKTIFAFFGKVLEEHRRTRVSGEPRDYIDCYLEELDMEHEDGHKSAFDAENLLACVRDLFMAGTETTSASVEWSLLYMMTYPGIQEKCREEIDNIRGDRDHLAYDDRVKMPYTQAILQEVLRFASVSAIGVAHAPIKDVHLNGYSIPKGTLIITDLSSAHYDEKYWKYPNEFNPENFLNEDGELVKAESFLPFSAGPRVCPGENLARMEIFLYFTTLMRHFEFHWPDPMSPPDLTPIFGISQKPKPFKMRLVPRT